MPKSKANEGSHRESSFHFTRVRLLVLITAVIFSAILHFCSTSDLLILRSSPPEESYSELTHHANTTIREQDSRPKDLRLFMMGDSIMRYQYESLAYFLRWNKWFDPLIQDRHLVNENSFHDNWTEFYNTTNSWLRPFEVCDCYRDDSLDQLFYPDTENHFFYDPSRNNMIIFVFAWGHLRPAHGRLPISQTTIESIPKTEFRHEHSNATPNVWSFEEWDEVINYTFSQLNGTTFYPTHAVLNSGLWMATVRDFSDARRSKLVETLHAVKVNATWRKTSCDKNGNVKRPARLNDPVMCELLDNCLDISWWQKMRRDLFWNPVHPKEPLYRGVNEDLLELLGHSFPSNYNKLNRSEWEATS